MKQIKWMAVIAIMAFALSSCEKESQSINESDLLGYWVKADDPEEHMRIMSDDKEMNNGHYLGYEWDEEDGITEQDLWEAPMYHGNSWFEWYVANNGSTNTLTLIHLSTTSFVVPKTYIIQSISSTQLVLQDVDDKSDIDTWNKQQ